MATATIIENTTTEQGWEFGVEQLADGVQCFPGKYVPMAKRGETVVGLGYIERGDSEVEGVEQPATLCLQILEADTAENLRAVINASIQFFGSKGKILDQVSITDHEDTLWHEVEGDDSIEDVLADMGFTSASSDAGWAMIRDLR